jgi:hypothetical protein
MRGAQQLAAFGLVIAGAVLSRYVEFDEVESEGGGRRLKGGGGGGDATDAAKNAADALEAKLETTADKHRLIGFLIIGGIVLQVLSGIFRPHIKHPVPVATAVPQASAPPARDEERAAVAVPGTTTSKAINSNTATSSTTTSNGTAAVVKPHKTLARRLFEVQHRILALVLVGLAYWNVHAGIEISQLTVSQGWQWVLYGIIIGTAGLVIFFEVTTRLHTYVKQR